MSSIEWKFEMDKPNDTHRHLSHLVGLYPGYALASYGNSSSQLSFSPLGAQESYTTEQVLAAAKVSLLHRGNGTGADADSGWEKVWRAACWAQLGDADTFYHELSVRICVQNLKMRKWVMLNISTVRGRAQLCSQSVQHVRSQQPALPDRRQLRLPRCPPRSCSSHSHPHTCIHTNSVLSLLRMLWYKRQTPPR